MHYGIFCPGEDDGGCGKLAFRLRPELKPDDLESTPLMMGHFVGKTPTDYIVCPHCGYTFDTEHFNIRKLRALGE